MANPYQSPSLVPCDADTAPTWYVIFYRLYWPAWWISVGLIVLSWTDLVWPVFAWIGLGNLGALVLGANVFPRLAGIRPEDFVEIDSRILAGKDDQYRDAIKRFAEGATLMYDRVCFGFRPVNEIACSIAAPSPENLDERIARELFEEAQSVFASLRAQSPEFATAVAGRIFRVSILSSLSHDGVELCRVVDHQINWKQLSGG